MKYTMVEKYKWSSLMKYFMPSLIALCLSLFLAGIVTEGFVNQIFAGRDPSLFWILMPSIAVSSFLFAATIHFCHPSYNPAIAKWRNAILLIDEIDKRALQHTLRSKAKDLLSAFALQTERQNQLRSIDKDVFVGDSSFTQLSEQIKDEKLHLRKLQNAARIVHDDVPDSIEDLARWGLTKKHMPVSVDMLV